MEKNSLFIDPCLIRVRMLCSLLQPTAVTTLFQEEYTTPSEKVCICSINSGLAKVVLVFTHPEVHPEVLTSQPHFTHCYICLCLLFHPLLYPSYRQLGILSWTLATATHQGSINLTTVKCYITQLKCLLSKIDKILKCIKDMEKWELFLMQDTVSRDVNSYKYYRSQCRSYVSYFSFTRYRYKYK